MSRIFFGMLSDSTVKPAGQASSPSATREQMYSQIALGTLTGVVHSGCLALIGVCLSPILLSRLDAAGYGTWVFLTSLTSYLNLFELGLGTALAKLWGAYTSTQDLPRLKSGVTTAMTLFGVIGVLAITTTYVAARIWPHTLALLPYFAVGTILMFCGEPMVGVLRGLGRPHWVNVTGTASTVFNAGLTIWLLLADWGLEALAVALVASSGLRLLSLAVLVRHVVPGERLFQRPHLDIFHEMLKLGAPDQITRVWVVAISPTNRIVLYSILGGPVLAAYDLGSRLVSAMALIPAIMLPTLLPAFSRLVRDKDSAAIDGLLLRATRYMGLMGLPICVFLLVFADPIIDAWISQPSPDVALAARILLVGAFANLMTGPFTQVLLGSGRPSLCVKKVIIGCFLGLSVPTVLAVAFGLPGFLIGESLAAAGPAIIFLSMFRSMTGFDAPRVIMHSICRITLALVPPVVCALLVFWLTRSDPVWQSLWTWCWLFAAFLGGGLAAFRAAGLLMMEEIGKIFEVLRLPRLLPWLVQRSGR